MKSQWVKQDPREYEIRCDGETVERRLTKYAACADRKWQVAFDNPAARIEVVHTPSGVVLETLEPCSVEAA